MAVCNDKEMLGYWFRTYKQTLRPNAFLYDGGRSFYMIANWTGHAGTQPTEAAMTFDLYAGPKGDDAMLAQYDESLAVTTNAFYEAKIRELLQDM